MHPLNVTRLVLGLVALGLAGLWLADETGAVSDSRYLFPVLLIGAGAVGLLAFGARGLMSRPGRSTRVETGPAAYGDPDSDPDRAQPTPR